MTNSKNASAIPEPSGTHSDQAWADSTEAVQKIQTKTVKNTPNLKASIETKTQALREQHQTLKSLRLIRQLTQQQLANADTKFSQAQISGIEKNDLTAIALETLQRYIEASGGKLEVRAVYDNGIYPLDYTKQTTTT